MNNLFKYHYLNIVTSSIYFLKSLQDMTFLQLSLVTWRKKNNIAVKNRFDSLPAIKSIWFRVESFSLGSRLGRGPRRRLGPEYEQHVLTCLKNPTDLLKYLDDVSPSLLDWVGSPPPPNISIYINIKDVLKSYRELQVEPRPSGFLDAPCALLPVKEKKNPAQ